MQIVKMGRKKTPNKPTDKLRLNQAENNSPVRLTLHCGTSFSEGKDVIAQAWKC